MSRRLQGVTITGTAGAALAVGDVITGSAQRDVVIQNGLVRVTYEDLGANRASHSMFRWNGDEYVRATDIEYGDRVTWAIVPGTADRTRVISADADEVTVALEWDAHSVGANTYARRDESGGAFYTSGGVLRYFSTVKLYKVVTVKRGREGMFVGIRSWPTMSTWWTNTDNAAGDRSYGFARIKVSFSSAGYDAHHPTVPDYNQYLGIDDLSGDLNPQHAGYPSSQTTGPWWAAAIPNDNVTYPFCLYMALEHKLLVASDQYTGNQFGTLVAIYTNDDIGEDGRPARHQYFVGAFPYQTASYAAEPTASLRARLVEKCPLDFDATGVPDDDAESTFESTSAALVTLADQIVAAEPGTLSTFGFTAFRESTASSGGLESWAQVNPSDGLRYFALRLVSSEEDEQDGGTLVTAECECVIAYPLSVDYADGTAESVAIEDIATISGALDLSDDINTTVTDTNTATSGRTLFATVSFTAQFWTV